jgi:hypothetical protein
MHTPVVFLFRDMLQPVQEIGRIGYPLVYFLKVGSLPEHSYRLVRPVHVLHNANDNAAWRANRAIRFACPIPANADFDRCPDPPHPQRGSRRETKRGRFTMGMASSWNTGLWFRWFHLFLIVPHYLCMMMYRMLTVLMQMASKLNMIANMVPPLRECRI